MARDAFGHLIGNFLSAFTQSKLFSERNATAEEERKARTKLFEIQLKREQEQSAAIEKLRSMTGAQPLQMPNVTENPGELGGFNIGPRTEGPALGPKMSLTQLLTNPDATIALLQSGQFKDIAQLDAAQRAAKFQERLLGQLGGGEGGGGQMGGMELTGFGLDTSGNMMPNFQQPQITTQTIQTPEGPRIVTLNSRTGQTVADLGAPPEANIDANEAGRLQGLFGAQQLVASLRSGFLNQDGTVNREAVLTSFGPGVPFTTGRTLSSQFEDAADAVIRARTGATANEEEIRGIARQFKPNPLDNDQTIKDKLDRFERFSSGALDAVTLPPRLRDLAKKVAPTGLGGDEYDGFSIVR